MKKIKLKDMEFMRQLFKATKKVINPPYSKKDYFILAVVGLLLLTPLFLVLTVKDTNLFGKAASINVVEPENGTIAGTATVVSDQNASGGKYVQFGSDSSIPSPTPTTSSGRVLFHSTSSQAFVTSTGTSVTLKGVNLQPVWGSGGTWGADKYISIKNEGFNTVRMVVFWKDMEPTQGAFSTTAFTTLDTAIARAKAAGLYVILDPIHLYGNLGDKVPSWAITGDSVTTIQTNGSNFLKYIATRYYNEPTVIGYDLVNEPARWPLDQNGVLRMYDTLIQAVRTVEPEKILIIEPTYGDTSIAGSFADFSNITNKANIVYSLHDYFGGGSTAAGHTDGYNDAGAQAGTYLWNGTTGYANGSTDATQMENHLLVHVNKLSGTGIPIWIGEFGIGDGVSNHDLWLTTKTGLFKKYNLGYTWWEYWISGGGGLSATNNDYSWKSWVPSMLQ